MTPTAFETSDSHTAACTVPLLSRVCGLTGRFAAWLPVLLMSLLLSPAGYAQIESTRVELAAERPAGEVLLHVRVLRGQTIESATLTAADDNSLTLTANPVPLPVTRWILLDAGDSMVNLQSAVQSAIQRFVRAGDAQTGLITYDSAIRTLQPTDRQSEIDNFLAEYTATAGESGCLGDALSVIADTPRTPERSLRVLVVTGGLSRQTACVSETLPDMPAPVDVIAITDSVSEPVQEMVERSGGDIITANLRTVEARVNEVRTLWGQPTYALRGTLPDDDSEFPQRATLTLMLSNGIEESVPVRFRAYEFPVAPEPTATATDIILETIPPRETDTPPTPTEVETTAEAVMPVPTDNPPPTAPMQATPEPVPDSGGDDGSDRAVLGLIIGAVLFIVGAVVLALALANVRRPGPREPEPSVNFYDTLDDSEPVEENTRIRERDIVDDDDLGLTRMATMRARDPKATMSDVDTVRLEGDERFDEEATRSDVEDEMTITQVLSDDGFQKMMSRSKRDEEVVGWLRLEGTTSGDYELTRRGAVVGRSQECDIQITDDRAISRQHARLDVQDDDTVTLSRLSATNPVVVGGVQVSNRHPLRPNDVIHLSDQTRLIFIQRLDDEDNDAQADTPDNSDDSFDDESTNV